MENLTFATARITSLRPRRNPSRADGNDLDVHPNPQPYHFGSFRIVRPLAASPIGERWLAADERTTGTAVVHARPAAARKRRLVEIRGLESVASTVLGPHLLPITGWGVWTGGPGGGERVAWVTPYTGSAAGVLTLRGHAASKGGTLGPTEAAEIARHAWAGVRAAHEAGRVGGPIDPDGVLIDGHGRVWIENHGLRRALGGYAGVDARVLRRLEIVSVAALAVELTTGLRTSMPEKVPGWMAVELPDLEIPPEWRAQAESWSEEALTAALTTALSAHDAIPGVASFLRDVLGSIHGMKDRASEATAKAKDAVKETAMSALKSAVGGMIGSVLDSLRGR